KSIPPRVLCEKSLRANRGLKSHGIQKKPLNTHSKASKAGLSISEAAFLLGILINENPPCGFESSSISLFWTAVAFKPIGSTHLTLNTAVKAREAHARGGRRPVSTRDTHARGGR